jgi:enoyl-CoA hydratase/carnithine racemase
MNKPERLQTDEVLYEAADHVATITLNAPDRMNTISGPMLAQLSHYLLEADRDPDVRCVILTGAGRAFCAGLDLTAQTQGKGILNEAQGVPTDIDLRTAPPTVLHSMNKPTICEMNGGAAGYGADTALGCDIRIMAQSAKFALSFSKRGILPESGGTWLLPRLVGWSKASQIFFTGRTMSAAECVAWGLASEAVPDAALMTHARALAREIAGNAPLAVQAAKRMMRMGLSEPFAEHVHHVYLQLLPLMRTQDAKEGMLAFVEKRTPTFEGR